MSFLLVRQADEKQYPSSQGPCSLPSGSVRPNLSVATDSSSSSSLSTLITHVPYLACRETDDSAISPSDLGMREMQHHCPVLRQHSSSTSFTPATKSATKSDFLSPSLVSPSYSPSHTLFLVSPFPSSPNPFMTGEYPHTRYSGTFWLGGPRKTCCSSRRRNARVLRDLWPCFLQRTLVLTLWFSRTGSPSPCRTNERSTVQLYVFGIVNGFSLFVNGLQP